MKKKPNPFETDLNRPADNGKAKHATDDPGHDYDQTSSQAEEQTRSSGVSSPSEPRRPGGGARQAPRRQSDEPLDAAAEPLVPGEILYGQGDVVINEGLEVTTLRVVNTADRPVQVGSHYHFAEVNTALDFDRDAAWGKRLAVLSGGAWCWGCVACAKGSLTMQKVDRREYVASYGPTTGDRIRLADTCLVIEVEEDRSAGGDEAVFGGGKSIRESMGQAAATRAEGTPDLVITGAVILDHWGVIKADIGIRDGRITAIGKASNPETMDGIHPDLVIGPSTEVMAGNGLIAMAGAIDTHVHFVGPQMLQLALASGVTTVTGGGTGPTEGSKATLATPGAWWMERMLEGFDPWPVNVLFLGRGNTMSKEAMWEQLRGGVGGFKVHEDWGATPAVIDACLSVAEDSGVQVAIHSDTLNEAGFVEDLLKTVAGRTFHAFHTEGAGGGHAPDIISIAGERNVLPASTNPTRPFTRNTVAEHLDMVMVAHHLNPQVPNDLAFAESRVRAGTIAAEDILQDLGAISIMSSDAQAMGRIGETVMRTWQTAHQMKKLRGSLPGDDRADNHRARRYVAKYTICPAVTHGLEREIGSIEVGKKADIVMWQPALVGIRPHMVFTGGMVATAALGDPSASIPTPQPVMERVGYNVHSPAAGATSVAFVAQAALDDGLPDRINTNRRFVAIESTRGRTKADMPENTALPKIEVDPDTYAVRIDGELADHEPADELPMAQRYFLF